MTLHSIIPVEILEARIAPAGLVLADYNAVTGELTLSGDEAPNQVTIFQTGTNAYRIVGHGTDIDAGGNTFRDIGKLTKLTLEGGAENDTFALQNLRTLTALSYFGGDGADVLAAENVSVAGPVELHGEGYFDTVAFTGASTVIKGNVTVDTGFGLADGIEFLLEAQATTIGGKVLFTGGEVESEFRTEGVGTVTLAKGVEIIAGPGGTSANFNSDGLLTIGKLLTGESILLTGSFGDDGVSFEGMNANLVGGIRVIGDVGFDGISSSNPAGTIKIGKLPRGQSLLLDDGIDGGGIFMNTANLLLAGGIEFIGGDGPNDIVLGPEAGTIKIGKMATGESIRFTGGVDLNTLVTSSANLLMAGGIDLSGGTGDHSIQIIGAGGKAVIGKLLGGQSILLTGSDGSDVVQTGVANLLLSGGIELQGGEGDNGVDLQNPTGVVKIGKLKGGQSILLTGGLGTEAIASSVARLTLDGAIDVDGDDGFGSVNIDSNGIVKIGKLATGQSVRLTGVGDAGFDLDLGGQVTLLGSLELNGSAGNDEIDLDGKVIVGKNISGISIFLNGGDGADLLDLADTVMLSGSVRFFGGNDADTLDLNGLDKLTVMAQVDFLGGAGEDVLDLNVRSLLISGGLSFVGGLDADSVSIVADGSIVGSVYLDLGASELAPQSLAIQSRSGLPAGLVMKSTLTVDFAAASQTDALTLLNLSVAKAVDIGMGNGNSLVTIDNLTALDEFRVDTRDGADVVNFERGNFFGNSLVKKIATIQLGLGDDELAIGSPVPAIVPPFPDASRVNFLGGLTADGGEGSDDRNDFAGQNVFSLALPTPTSFEQATLV